MEGIGSRLGRVSSRYGPAATVFNGPVRKWKKKWVLASSSSSGLNYQTSSHSQSNAQKLLLCRWTPIHPPTSSEADETSPPPDEPPKRKFRYTPIAVLEEQKSAEMRSVKDEVRMKEMDQLAAKTAAAVGNEALGELNVNEVFKEETQETSKNLNSPRDGSRNNLDLALCLNGQKKVQDSAGKSS
ncbi:hybrid signal transduction protein dokA isoform X2 [Cucumis melo var. makuwa]|uniref:Hybrid signal transduction protein dokA isoform X2 n=1 Tax=Cucumis melo var. makuwa TaxID=1194695 RepID=A0A5D3DHK3_CUCMM|nr:hybrid signal transduction protein dokA isoform X2 [Cucumis melo var. makuwa]TYK23053.1 hybrid signal transduction protein dokA isoform X2 [Cucumis melo var. makuwa]